MQLYIKNKYKKGYSENTRVVKGVLLTNPLISLNI